MIELTPTQKITKARTALVLDQPFFGSILLRLKMEPVDDLAKKHQCYARTNGRRIQWDTDAVNELTLDQVKGALAHEVLHVVNKHHLRRGTRDPKRWNYATDYTINDTLNGSGFALPEGALINPAFSGMYAEAVYSRLPDPPPDNGGGDGPSGGDGAPSWGDVEDATNEDGSEPTPADIERMDNEQDIDNRQAINAAKMAGKLPGDLKRLLDATQEGRVNWREALKRFLTERAEQDYTWQQPNRRTLAAGLYLPRLVDQGGSATVVIAVDTSGSVDAKALNVFASEASSVLETIPKSKALIMYCDTQVEEPPEELEHHDLPLTLEHTGGGGTDFRPPFAWLDEHPEHNPAAIIYLTDGYCDDFPADPGTPTLWAIYHDTEHPDFKPPFGEVIYIPIGKE